MVVVPKTGGGGGNQDIHLVRKQATTATVFWAGPAGTAPAIVCGSRRSRKEGGHEQIGANQSRVFPLSPLCHVFKARSGCVKLVVPSDQLTRFSTRSTGANQLCI